MKGVMKLTVPQYDGTDRGLWVLCSRFCGVIEWNTSHDSRTRCEVIVDGRPPIGVTETPEQVLALWAEATS